MKNLIEKLKEKLAASKLNMGIFLSCLLVSIICIILLFIVLSRDTAVNSSVPARETASPTDAEKKETIEKTDSTTENEHITDSETTDDATENETSPENTLENTEAPSGNGSENPTGSSVPSSTEGNPQGGNSAGGNSAGNNSAGGNSQGGNSSGEAAQINVNISAVNSWESNGQTYVQYSIDLTNPTGQKIAGWQLNLDFTTEITISDSWGGTLTSSGTQLNIAPVDYTNEINPQETKNLGFIIYSGSYASVSSYSINNSGGSQGGASNPSGPNQTVPQPPNPPSTPVVSGFYSEHGALHVSGTSLCDKNGTPIQLKGVSTHGLSWFPEYVNADAFSSLRSFGVNTIRLALYTSEYNGYCSGGDQSSLKALVRQGIQYATEQDMYVIVDWHVLNDRNPNTYIEQAVSFFNEISSQYAGQGNIIYEICNEPNSGVAWYDGSGNDIKTYAERVINTIRSNDANAVIIVGTPTWSQDVDVVAANPLDPSRYSNIMYALHFYAATHKDSLRNKLISAYNQGLPIFVSEFSICEASGNGWNDTDSAGQWMNLLNSYGISYVAWNLSNKAESSSLLNNSCGKTGGFSYDDFSESGKWYLNQLGN